MEAEIAAQEPPELTDNVEETVEEEAVPAEVPVEPSNEDVIHEPDSVGNSTTEMPVPTPDASMVPTKIDAPITTP